jgi:hypothetical protein
MMASFWCTQNPDTDTVIECFPLLQPQYGLSELFLDNLVLKSRDDLWDADDWDHLSWYSKAIVVELFKKDRSFSDSLFSVPLVTIHHQLCIHLVNAGTCFFLLELALLVPPLLPLRPLL